MKLYAIKYKDIILCKDSLIPHTYENSYDLKFKGVEVFFDKKRAKKFIKENKHLNLEIVTLEVVK